MRNPAFVALALLGTLMAAMPVPTADAQAGGVRYQLTVDCPSDPQQLSFVIPPRVEEGCPIRAVDGDDLMGDPSLAVDPLRPENLIIGSLHGRNFAGEGPDAKSRQGQVFTTFTSQDEGAYWVDNPYFPPEDIGPSAYGQHPQVTIDPYGHVFVGSLYAIPLDQNESAFQYVIGAQKFETIDTINEEQSASDGSYHVDYVLPVHNGSRIHQMWFLFNPATDNMTMVWHESPATPFQPVPACSDAFATVNANGYYVVLSASTTSIYLPPEVWQESNGRPGLQTDATCPESPDQRLMSAPSLPQLRDRLGLAAAPARAVPAVPVGSSSPGGSAAATPIPVSPLLAASSLPVAAIGPSSLPLMDSALGDLSGASASSVAARQADPSPVAPAPPRPTPAAAPAAPVDRDAEALAAITSWMRAQPPRAPRVAPEDGNATENATAPGVIGLVWTSADTGTPYYRQNETRVIGPCSSSTNPVLSFGLLYIGCVSDPAAGEFRWNPETVPGTVELFRLHPDGGEPEYMGPAPAMPGVPRLGVRSDGRLALVAAGAEDGSLLFQAAFGRYEPADQAIAWTEELSLGRGILPYDPERSVLGAAIQDVIYREQSGALHVILKTTLEPTQSEGGVFALPRPNIRKDIVALDEEYGLLTPILELGIGDPAVRAQDSTIMGTAEAAFQDISDDFLQLPPGPFSYEGRDFGVGYQREFFAIADYGTVLFAEVIEDTDLRAPGFAPPPVPPAPVASPASTSLIAPVVGTSFAGLLALTMAAHRRKNPLAAFTKGE